MPKELVLDALTAQFAACEVTCLRVLTVTWELKRLQRWQKFHACSLTYLKEQNNVSRQSLDYWRSWCNDQGLDCFPQDRETSQHLLEKECLTLEQMRTHFKRSENTALSLGIYDAKDLERSRTTYSSDGHESDLEGSETETLELSASSNPEQPPTSDPGVLCSSSSSDSDLYVPFARRFAACTDSNFELDNGDARP